MLIHLVILALSTIAAPLCDARGISNSKKPKPTPTKTSRVQPPPSTKRASQTPSPVSVGVTSSTPPPLVPAMKATEFTECSTPGKWALTFDDGPSKNIPQLLAKLSELGINATFFVNALNYADMTSPNSSDSLNLNAIYNQGHQVASHTYSHKDLTTLSVQGMWDEMRKNDDAIKAIIGRRPIHMRAPFLAISNLVLTAMGSWGYEVLPADAGCFNQY
jgi:peptidoglycan/xylan/chitin deacetylase (PgdA/CDA1 family)